MNEVKPKATAIYARISDDTEGRAAGVTRQIEDCRYLVQRTGWTLSPYEPFIDNDISASTRSKARRPAFERLMELVEAGVIDGIVYYSTSRLTRRPREFEDIVELVERTGLRLDSVVSGRHDLTTADGRRMARYQSANDTAEAEITSERVKRAFVQRREEGKPNPSSRTFGYEAGGMIVNEAEAVIIREAAERIIKEGWSLGQIVRDWSERGIPTVRGAQGWTRTTVKRTLTNPRVAGLISHSGEILGRGNFDAILTREQQAQIKTALAGARNGNTTTFRQRKHVLAGFLVCGKCGKPMKVNAMFDEDGTYRKDSFVICSVSQYGCGRVKRNLKHIETYLDQIVRNRIGLAEMTGDGQAAETMSEHAEELQSRLAEINGDIEDLQAAFSAGEIRFKDYNTSLGALRNLQEVATKALTDLEADAQIDPDLDLLATWEDGSVEERRTVMEWAIDHVKVHPIGKVGPIRAREMIPMTTEIVMR